MVRVSYTANVMLSWRYLDESMQQLTTAELGSANGHRALSLNAKRVVQYNTNMILGPLHCISAAERPLPYSSGTYGTS